MSRLGKIGRRWLTGRGGLGLIAAVFVLSAVIRLDGPAGRAIAKEVVALGETSSAPEAQLCQAPAELQGLIDALKQRDARLTEREREIEERSKTVEIAEQQARAHLAELAAAESRLSATIAQSETAAESDLARLTAVYENMKPKETAALFEEMAPEFAAGFIGRMRPDAAAQVMAGLSPQTAYSVSVILAGRNAAAPTE